MSTPDHRRAPRAFSPDDPALIDTEPRGETSAREVDLGIGAPDPTRAAELGAAPSWGAILGGSLLALAGIALTASFARFVSAALEREDWIGWTAFALLLTACGAALALCLREITGLMRLRRLTKLRRHAEAALRDGDAKRERAAVEELKKVLARDRTRSWAMARFREHEQGVRDAGDLLTLADRELVAPLDADAKRIVLAAAKRVSVVTALSPVAIIAVSYVAIENLRLLRVLATLYGGRPGFVGGLRLARMVLVHIVATGGVALTDDLLGQFLGQDLVRRLSRRLGEGVFNGALTARIGAAAIEVVRPLPFIEAPPVRLRDFVAELVRGQSAEILARRGAARG
jgi:putative membrane protein